MEERESQEDVVQPVPFAADFSKPLEFLFHCHSRIATRLVGLIRLSEDLKPIETVDAEDFLQGSENTLRHLATSGLKHTRDEEDSLFPRLRAHKDAGVDELFEVLGHLEAQHKRAASIESSLEGMVKSFRGAEAIDENRVALFKDLAEGLYDLYRPHIQIENEFVFPSAGKILTPDELSEIGKEIYSRRQVTIDSRGRS